jgi:hypothetical protein
MKIFKSAVKEESFWEQLLADTKHFQEAALYSNVLHLDNDFDSIFKNFFKKYKGDAELRNAAKIRVHLQGGRNEASLIRLEKNPPSEEESLNDWGTHLFDGEPWCIVLDKASGCIDEITFPIAKWVEPLLSLYPIGSMVVDVSIYIGKYGYTPFGAHIDVAGISVLHLHLGPNKKEMTIWSAEEFRKLSGSEDHICHDFEPLIPKGKTYSIEAGDIFHLPAGTHYHIGKADEFSVGLTIGLKRETPKSILQKALKEHQKNGEGIGNLDVVETYKLKKKSNAGFMKTPVLKKASVSDLKGRKIRINRPFQLVLKEKNESELSLYIRGRQLSVSNDGDVKKCLYLLNQGVEMELTNETFNKIDIDQTKIMNLITMLYNYGGLILLQ